MLARIFDRIVEQIGQSLLDSAGIDLRLAGAVAMRRLFRSFFPRQPTDKPPVRSPAVAETDLRSRRRRIIPCSASVISIRVLSMVKTRSDSSMQSAKASRFGNLRVGLERELRRPTHPRQWSPQIVRDIVERFTHSANQRLVFLQDAVELAGEFRQFTLSLTFGHPFCQVAGVND